jgi:hypothetical protein
MELLRELVHSLQKLLGLHRQLWDQVRTEREALVNANRNSIQEIALAKKALVISIREIETKRLSTVSKIAGIWKKPGQELLLSEIILAVQTRDPPLSQSLQTLQNALRHLLERIQILNESNRQLVDASMKHVDVMKRNLMGEVEPRSSLYTQSGNKSPTSAQAAQSRFLSTEA